MIAEVVGTNSDLFKNGEVISLDDIEIDQDLQCCWYNGKSLYFEVKGTTLVGDSIFIEIWALTGNNLCKAVLKINTEKNTAFSLDIPV